MMQTGSIIGITNVHSWPFFNGFKPFKTLMLEESYLSEDVGFIDFFCFLGIEHYKSISCSIVLFSIFFTDVIIF